MTNEFIHFDKINRLTWQNLHRKTTPPLTEEELNSIKSFNDEISLQDVVDIYLPLTNLIRIYKRSKEDLSFSKGIFLQKELKKQPFIIGVSGSVAVGKSTTSRLLQILLSRTFENAKVELVTTDGFLYPNAILQERQLLNRKGFPAAINYSQVGTFNYVIKEIPGQEEGYTYDAKEVKVTVKVVDVFGEKYGSVTYDGDATFTNTYTNIRSISGSKTWVKDSEKTRPKTITVNLYANGQLVSSKAVSEADGWKYTFDNLPIDDQNGQKINYTIGEDAIENYTSKVEGFNLINTYDPKDPGNKTPDPKNPGNKTPDPKDPANKKTNNKSALPKTGEQAAIWLSAIGLSILVVLGGAFVIIKKKKH